MRHKLALLFLALAAACAGAEAPTDYRLAAIAATTDAVGAPPDLSAYSEAAVRARYDARCGERQRVASSIGRMVRQEQLHTLTDGRLMDEWLARQRTNPRALLLRSGCFTLSSLARRHARALRELGDNTYLATLPIVVFKEATLLIEGEQLRLAQETGAFFSNSGQVFIIDGALLGWNVAAEQPTLFESKDQFRPFFIAWGGSDSVLLRADLSYLGYAKLKSYGVSFSQYGSRIVGEPPPRAWLLHSTFRNNYFGFYTYEAEDIVLAHSRFEDNIVYGIDPHDYSRHLLIAHNEVSGTRKLHGLIFSRGVTDSWVIGNHLHHNAGSGIVMDRQSSDNLLIDNVAVANGGDGLSLYESARVTTVNNVLARNERHGYYVRNSTGTRSIDDRIDANGRTAYYVFTSPLSEAERDLERDPFEQRASLAATRPVLRANGSGVFNTHGNVIFVQVESAHIEDPVTPLFRGSLAPLDAVLSRRLFGREHGFRVELGAAGSAP